MEEIRSIANELAELYKPSRDSLKLRAEGIQVISMQPHAHPKLPLLIDWAYVPHPVAPVEIEVPPLDAVGNTNAPHE